MHTQLVWLYLLFAGLVFSGTANAQLVLTQRDPIPVDEADPNRKNGPEEEDVSRRVRQKVKGSRGAKRKPRKYKKVTAKDLLKLVDASLKAGARGARGARLKKAQRELKAGTFTFEVSGDAWAGPNQGKTGARGAGKTPQRKKTLSQSEVLKELNVLERKANALGYSMLDNPNKEETFESDFEQGGAALDASYKKASADLKKENISKTPLRFRKKPLFESVKFKAGARGSKASRIRMLKKKATYTIGPPKQSSGSRGRKGKAVKTYTGEKIDRGRSFGKKSLAAVSLVHTLKRSASEDALKLKSSTGFVGHVFKKKVLETTVSVDFGVTRTGKLSGGVSAKWFGRSVKAPLKLKGSVPKGKTITKSDRWSKRGQKSKKIRFALGPVPCSVEVGAAFSAGIEYRAAFSRAAISVDMTPFINADAFARFAVDIGIASAGIEGRVTLLDAEMRTTGELGLALDTSGDLIAYDVFSGDRARETLSGRLSAYAKVGLGICCNKKFSHKIFGWRGLKKTDRLYRISREARLVSTKPVNEETSSNLQVSTPQGKVPEGPWGGWQPAGVCPMGSYAFAAAQKIVPKRGKKKDDLGLVGLMFRCRTPGGVETKAVWSTNLNVGEWSEWGQCPKGEAFVGYRIKLQKKQGKKKDDTAANEIEFVCGDGAKVNKVVKGAGRWGTWRKGQRCKADARIDHFSLKVESGKKKDHTGVNAIKVRCREYRKVKTGDKRTLSCPSGKLEGTRCRLADADLDAFPTKCAQRGKCGCGFYVSKKGKPYARCFGGKYKNTARKATPKTGGKPPPPPAPYRTCPAGWSKSTHTLKFEGKKSKKRDVCLKQLKGVSKVDAKTCATPRYWRKSKKSKSEFARTHECNLWLDTKRKGVFTFPKEG